MYGLLALGIVLVYRATRVINFAVGGMGLVGAGLLVLLTLQYHVPYWLAVLAALVVGTLYGGLLEITIIRRLFDAPRVIVLVATIGIAQLSLAILIAYPNIDNVVARFPLAIGAAHEFASIRVTGAQLSILIVVPLVAAFLSWFLTRTTFGKTREGRGREPRPRAAQRHQPAAGVDVRVGRRGCAGDAVDRARWRARRAGPPTW